MADQVVTERVRWLLRGSDADPATLIGVPVSGHSRCVGIISAAWPVADGVECDLIPDPFA